MKILVTGGAGYIGSHYVRQAIGAGFEPVVLDNLSTGHRWAVPDGVPFYEMDIADSRRVREVLRTEKIDAVVHFAASAYVGESVENPSKYFNNNYLGTLSLLDAMVDAGVGQIVFSSTCAIYGEPETMPIVETLPKNPINPYGLAKYFVEQTLGWYSKAYDFRYAALRYFNAAGADPQQETGEVHDPETHLIPLVLEAALGRRKSISVFGSDYDTPDGTCVRDYIHILDLCSAHTLALKHLESGGESIALNLGNGSGHSVREIIEAARKVTGRDINVIDTPRREGDPPFLVADSSRAINELGWKPQYGDIEVIIKHAWQWLNAAIDRGLYPEP